MYIKQAYVGLTQQNEHALIDEDGNVLGSLELVDEASALEFTLASDVVEDDGLVVLGACFAADKIKSVDLVDNGYYKILPDFIADSESNVSFVNPLIQNISSQDYAIECVFDCDWDANTILCIDTNNEVESYKVNLKEFCEHSIQGSRPNLTCSEFEQIIRALLNIHYETNDLGNQSSEGFDSDVVGSINIITSHT